MDRTFTLARGCKGLIVAVGNHLPANVPGDRLAQYIGYLQTHWHLRTPAANPVAAAAWPPEAMEETGLFR
jgi:hypothetical protein